MPELPEVETIVRELRKLGLVGACIESVVVFWSRSVSVPALAMFRKRLAGCSILDVRRRGKYIVMQVSGDQTLTVHLRMTGQFRYVAHTSDADPHEHVVLAFANGMDLRFHDTRKFGRWCLYPKGAKPLASLGPEPLDRAFTSAEFRARLARHHRQIKPLLLDQSFVAGIGNIYADEALFRARIHPCRNSSLLSVAEQDALYRAIRHVLRQGLRNMGTSLGTGAANFYSVSGRRGRNRDHLQVFRRTGEPCPACAALVERIIVGQRSTHICPHCQVR